MDLLIGCLYAVTVTLTEMVWWRAPVAALLPDSVSRAEDNGKIQKTPEISGDFRQKIRCYFVLRPVSWPQRINNLHLFNHAALLKRLI